MEVSQRKEIAQTIVNQLGGRRFMLMTGTKSFAFDSTGGVSFKICRNKSKCNHVVIEYDYSKDLYNVVFGRIHGTKYSELKRTNGCYFDMLVEMFEDYTGLYTTL